MEEHTVSRLIGAPPGYVGYEEGGQLTEAVRRKPYCVILFDEFEKAHTDVSNVMLQILDDGRLTDAQGRLVDFKNSIIIMTSNLGSQHLLSGLNSDGDIRESARAHVMDELRAHCRPEFLNRVDEVVLFTPLTLGQLARIVDLQIALLATRLAERNIGIVVTDAGRAHLAQTGYDPAYGARPLKRLIQRTLETRIGRAILSGTIPDGSSIVIDAADDELIIRPAAVQDSPEAATSVSDDDGPLIDASF